MVSYFAQQGIRFKILSSVAGYQVTSLLLPAVPELTGLDWTVQTHLQYMHGHLQVTYNVNVLL